MGENTIAITIEEYKQLLAATVRINVFADYVKREKYSIDREKCGQFLGFEVGKAEED